MSGREAICAWNTSSSSFILSSSADGAQGIEINEIQHSLWHVHFILKVKTWKIFWQSFHSELRGKSKGPKGVCVQKGWGYVDPVSPVQPWREWRVKGLYPEGRDPDRASFQVLPCTSGTVISRQSPDTLPILLFSSFSTPNTRAQLGSTQASCSSFLWFLLVQTFFLTHAFLCLF